MNPSSDGSHDNDLAAVVSGLTSDEVFSLLVRWQEPIDWATAPTGIELTGGGTLSFDRRRRCANILHPNGGSSVIDLGRRDRMRTLDAIVTPDLAAVPGPSVHITPQTTWSSDRGEVALRDPLDRKAKRATDSLPAGAFETSRWFDGEGRLVLVVCGDLSAVTGFGTFLMDGGSSYAHLKTVSGLGCFYDARRAGFMNAVTPEAVEQARAEGFAEVLAKGRSLGVVFDCGAPGDYLALSVYGGKHGGTVGVVVDLRRPPVKDGAIVDPPLS